MTAVRLTARFNLQAAGKSRRFSILAYTGGKLIVSGFDLPVVIDLAGLRANASVPIILDHDATTANTIGQTSDIENDGRKLVLKGSVTGKSPQVQNVLAQADDGYQWQASVGCLVEAEQRIEQGQRVTVNGQTIVGPVIVARESILRETSVLPTGADSSTSVNLAARAASGEQAMSFEEWVESQGFKLEQLTEQAVNFLSLAFEREMADMGDNEPAPASEAAAEALVNLRANRASEHDRIAAVELVAKDFPKIAAAAIRGGWSRDRTEIAVLRQRVQPQTPDGRTRHQGPDQSKVLCASFAMTAGGNADYLAKHYGEDVIDAATQLGTRGATLRTVMDHVLKAAGNPIQSNRITDTYIRAAFDASRKLQASGLSTVDLPGILSDSANKLLLQGYDSVPTTWQEFCTVGSLSDFKSASRYRLITDGEFEKLGAGGVIKHTNLNTEQTYTNQLDTYARMLSLSRKDIINDDLGAFEMLPQSLGRLAVLKLERVIYTLLLANTGSFFSAGNSNYQSGAATALDIDALTAAETLFMNQVDDAGNPIMLMPSMILCGPSLSVTANQVTRDTQVVAIGVDSSSNVTPGANPHGGRFRPVVTPWLENSNITGNSTTGWYLLSAPQGTSGLIEVGFLNGQRTPTIESGELDFSQLGMTLRGYWDFGVAFQDPRYGVYSTGTA